MKLAPIEFEAIKALAGEASVDPRIAAEILDESNARAEDCETVGGRALFAAVEAMVRNAERIDAVVLFARLPQVDRQQVLEIATSCDLGVTKQRLGLLRDRSLRRQYTEALRAVARVVADTAQPLANAVAEASRLLATWQDESTSLRALDDSVMGLVDEMEAVAAGTRATTLPTGLEALDAVIGGLQPTLTIVGALPGVGKSALVAGVCRKLAERGVSVGLLSLEDERMWLTRRLMAQASDVPVFVLANKALGKNQQARVLEAAGPLHTLLTRVLVDDRSGLTASEVVASARRMVARGAKAILVDHLGEVRLERTERHDLDIADALRELRALAKSHRVPVVVLSHLRRREGLTVDSEPKLTDFAFSSGVERMARVALGLWRGEAGQLNCTVLKQTQGAAGLTVALQMDTSAGVVVHSPASDAARQLYGDKETAR